MLIYYLHKVLFFFFKPRDNRHPLENKFEVRINNEIIKGRVKHLINFIDNQYPIQDIDVNALHSSINWKEYFEGLTIIEKIRRNNFHMSIILRADLDYPIILAVNNNGELLKVIDGLHRIKKSFLLKKKTIKSFIVPIDSLLKFKKESNEKF